MFADCETVGGEVADGLFVRGLCLPSGSKLSTANQNRVIDIIRAQAR